MMGESHSKLLKMLKHKRGRFAFYHDLGLHHTINREGLDNEVKILPISFSTYSHYAAFSKSAPEEIIQKIKYSGELIKIHRKYYFQKQFEYRSFSRL